MDKIGSSPDKKWTLYSYLIIGFLFFLLLLRWPLLPNFLDIYYHLVTAQGFSEAGGFTSHDFWSYAPQGRVHLYPPLFHFILLVLIKSGIPALFAARLFDVIIFPLFLVVIWIFMRVLFNSRLAFFSVLISSSIYSFYLASSNFMPVTLAFMFGLLSLLCQERGKIISAAIFLSLCFYTHAQIPWFFISAYILYGLFNRANLARCLKTVLLGISFSLPIIIYLFGNRVFYHPKLAYENFVIEINLYVILAVLVFKKFLKEKERNYLILSLAISALPFIFSYPYRYVSGQGLLGWILLSSQGLEWFYLKMERQLRFFVAGLILIFLFFCPALLFKRDMTIKLSILNSTYINLVSSEKNIERPNDYSLSSSKFIAELVKIIKENSQKKEIIFTNLNFAGTMISALSERADAKGMLNEVSPNITFDPVVNARLIIWFKDPQGKQDVKLSQTISKYNLEKIAETDIAYVYRNNFTHATEKVIKATIPNPIILIVFGFIAAFLVWDWLLKDIKRNNC